MQAVIFADDALAPVDRLWEDAVAHLARRLGRAVALDPADVPADRIAALGYLEAWATGGAGSWRSEIARFYEDHIPIYVRPEPSLNAAVRQLAARGIRLAAWSPGPPEASLVVTHFLGLARRFETQAVDPDPAGAVRVAAELDLDPAETLVVSASPAVLAASRAAGAPTAAALWTGAQREPLLTALPALLAERPDELVALAVA